jgi:hypothetical protein
MRFALRRLHFSHELVIFGFHLVFFICHHSALTACAAVKAAFAMAGSSSFVTKHFAEYRQLCLC